MMFSSTEPISREMDRLNSFLFSNIGSSSFKNSEAELFKSKEIMGSDPFQQSNNGGLARYRSAPSSFFAGILDGDGNNPGENFVGHDGSSSSESESMFTALLSENNSNNKKGSMFGSSMKQEVAEEYGNNGYENLGVSGMGSYSVGVQMQNRGSIGVQMQNRESLSNGNGGSNNLIRQSSSPAGFLNGFDIMRDVENYRSSNRETSSSSIGLSSNFMPIIAENESWNENCLKRNSDGDLKMFSNNFTGINSENVVSVSGLTHHLSLPKTSTEVAAVEKYLRFQQDSVPCKIRAKRGCATHPRSIAERVRRTRISDRMKKLQELFPDMDKQTNTADMLDLAVDYIKDLQKQVQTLRDKKAKCSCPSKHSYGT